jgi:ABC-type glycerol-3-phosphate transport system permease component
MSQPLAVCLVAVAVNLVGVLIIYAVMAQTLARLAWRGCGIFGVIAIIIIAQLFWIAPALLIVVPRDSEGASSYALWFGNWIVSAFGVVLFLRRAKTIPRSLEDSERLDGLGALGIWRQVVFPFVRRELGLLAVFTVMATVLPFWAFINQPETGKVIVLYQRVSTPAEQIGIMIACSLIGAVFVIAIFFIAKRRD